MDFLQADASKAETILGWRSRVGFEQLVRLMVDADLQDLENQQSGILKRSVIAGL